MFWLKYFLYEDGSSSRWSYALFNSEEIDSFEIFLTVYKLTQRNIQENLNAQQHRCENLKYRKN